MPILALIIGINHYASSEFHDLAGAVADADAFEEYLKQNLEVPPINIISLRDEEASREAILFGFASLRDNPKYGKGECAIIIYFAGHGAQVEKPDEWKDWVTITGKIEMLCPSDIGLSSTAIIDGKEHQDKIPGIPDRTISTYLNHISDIKGNNITLILDCCSSGGLNRSSNTSLSGEYIVRQIHNPPPIMPMVDEKIWSRSGANRVGGDLSGKHSASHVLVAACGRDQFAYEKKGLNHGEFTYALLKVLYNEDIRNLTYTALMQKLSMPARQTPHCEGLGVNWRLFNNSIPGADDCFVVSKRKKDGPMVLHAGVAQGITPGSLFSVHATNLLDTPCTQNIPLGCVVVKSVDTFSSIVEPDDSNPDFEPPNLCYCKLVKPALRKIPLYCDDESWLRSVLPSQILETISAEIVGNLQSCDLQLTILDGRVFFDHYSALVTPYLGTRNRYSVEATDVVKIRNVVQCSLHFYYHLTRSGPNEFRNVWMELKELQSELTADFNLVFKPVGKNLIETEPAEVIGSENVNLGLTIFNQTDLPLYPYLFYFDPSELSIVEWYKPPYGAGRGMFKKVDPPLPARSRLSLGYGDGGINPWQFVLPENQKKDLGFFKLFLSSRPAYFESICKASPFNTEEETFQSRAGKSPIPEPPPEDKWGTQLVTVIQVAQ